MSTTRAIILAAGMCQRLGLLTRAKPKCMIKFSGKSLLERQLEMLEHLGINDIVVITGYQSEIIEDFIAGRARCLFFPNYSLVNNLHTLHYYKQLLDCPTLIIFSDVFVDFSILQQLNASTFDATLAVDTASNLSGTMRVLRENENITDLGSHIPPSKGSGNFIGMAAFSKLYSCKLAEELSTMISEGNCENAYYTAVLPRLVKKGFRIKSLSVAGEMWFEVDTITDYIFGKLRTFGHKSSVN